MWFRDTLANLVSGLGTAKDKTTGNFHTFTPRNRADIEAAYRGNWIARKIVDVPAFDMLREWRDWQADDEQRTLIEAAEKALGLQAKLLNALKLARRDGGSALLIGDGATDPSQPLIPDALKQGGIRYIAVLSRWEITPGPIERDPASDYFSLPAYYTLATPERGQQQVHPSRVIRLIGAPILDMLQANAAQGWGDSVLDAVMEAVDQAASSAAYVNAMLPEAKQDVISVPGLSNYLSTSEGTSALTERFAYAARMKSMFGMLLLEGDGKSPEGEVFEQKQISFAGLPDVVRLYLSIAAGAADIPATRLLGKSPDGQNATGDSDTRNYYDRVAAEQKVEFGPCIAPLDELLIRHALGNRPPEIWYQWNPLYQSSESEKATTFGAIATAITGINGTGLVPPEVLAAGVKGWLQDSGQLPGIDAAYDEHGDAPLTEGPAEADQYDANGNPGEGYTGLEGEDPGNVVPFPGQQAAVGDAARMDPDEDGDDTNDPLDEEDEATEEEIAAVTPERLRALFGAEMLAGVRISDKQPGGLSGIVAAFNELLHPRGEGGKFAPKGSGAAPKATKAATSTAKPKASAKASKPTKGEAALKTVGVSHTDEIHVLSKRVKAYAGAKTVQDFVDNHPKGKAYALRKLAADHQKGVIGFKAAGSAAAVPAPAPRPAAAPKVKPAGAKAAPKPRAQDPEKYNPNNYSDFSDTDHHTTIEVERDLYKTMLTKPETGAEKTSIGVYSGNGYSAINGYLRGTNPASALTKQNIGNIDAVLARSRMPEDTVVYRGIKPPFSKEILAAKVGSTISDPGYVSTSLKGDTSKAFATPEGVVLKMLLPKGNSAYVMNGRGASHYPKEHEVLLPRGSRFRVKSLVGNVMTVEVL